MANGRVREYIGARYVPIFADPVTWDDERAYDPLTMVQYSGETYMSKQFVPVGAPLPTVGEGEESNEFWVHMSNWNAQVEAYREEVMRYAEEVLAFDGRIDSLEDALPIADFDSTNTVKAAFSTINADNWVTTDRINSGAVTTAKIADANVTTAKIADANVTTAKIADSNVTTDKLNSGAVTTAKIADANVTTAKIADANVTTAKIADANVTTAKIADGNVTTEKIAGSAVTTAKIADANVTTGKIADGAITKAKLATEYFVLFGDSWGDFSTQENWYAESHIGEILNTTLKNYSVGGAGFTGGTSLISSQLTTANGNMTSTEKAATKYVVVVGGLNDMPNNDFDDSSWKNAITSVFTTAHGMFPNAKLIYAPNICAPAVNAMKAKNCVQHAQNYIVGDMPYIDAPVVAAPNLPYFFIGHLASEVLKSDNYHLNAVGSRAFGKCILAACQGANWQPMNFVFGFSDTLYGINVLANSQGMIQYSGWINTGSSASGTITPSNVYKEYLIYFQNIIGEHLTIAADGAGQGYLWLRTQSAGTLLFGATNTNHSYYL